MKQSIRQIYIYAIYALKTNDENTLNPRITKMIRKYFKNFN